MVSIQIVDSNSVAAHMLYTGEDLVLAALVVLLRTRVTVALSPGPCEYLYERACHFNSAYHAYTSQQKL
jgi:hypothetical protein